MAKERQRAHRFSIKQIVQLIFSHDQTLDSKAVNISSSGILVATPEAVEPGTPVFLMLSTELGYSEKLIRAEGLVTRCTKEINDYLTGIEFSIIDEEDLKTIEYLDQHEALSASASQETS
jgi:PilZ domain